MLLQRQRTELRPLTTAHLAQTMTLMGLNTEELRQKIERELANNPALELVHERRCPTCRRPLAETGPCPVCSRPRAASEEAIVFVSAREDFFRPVRVRQAEDLPPEEYTPQVEDLPTYVLRQIAPELEQDDRALVAHLLTSLDQDGLLTQPLIEFARYHHVSLAHIQRVLRLIQRSDPIGVGSPSTQEALLIQLEVLGENQPVPDQAEAAIRHGMKLLSRHQYPELGRLLGISTREAQQIAQFISENLNPFPGRMYWGDVQSASPTSQDVYQIPDVVIGCLDDQKEPTLVVEILSPVIGRLRINPLFRQALEQAPSEKSEAWNSDMEQASLLIKCLQQRENTIVRMMKLLVQLERNFILHGNAHLKPITRAYLAETLEVHESTISRAVSNKAVQLPTGRIIPLAKFFDRSLPVRTALCEIIAGEDEPLTDTQLVRKLGECGYRIARRTVAKYRAMEGILPAHLRATPA